MEIPIDEKIFDIIVIAETCRDLSHYLEFLTVWLQTFKEKQSK